MLKKLPPYKGYFLLEALISLSVITTIFVFVVPQFTFFKQQLQQGKQEVTCARLLYEFSKAAKTTTSGVRDGKNYTGNRNQTGITVKWGEVSYGFKEIP